MPNPNRFRCANCRTRRTDAHLMFLHELHCKQEHCDCGGYHFRHRKGSRLCYANPKSDMRHAMRRGESEQVLWEILLEDIWENTGARVADSEACPF